MILVYFFKKNIILWIHNWYDSKENKQKIEFKINKIYKKGESEKQV